MMSADLRPLGELVKAPGSNGGYKALLLAAVIEAVFVALLIWKSTEQTPPPAAVIAPVTISLVPPSPPKPLPPLPKPKVQPQPKPEPRPVPRPKRQPQPASHPVAEPPEKLPLPQTPMPSSVQAPATKAAVTPPPPPSAVPASPAVREDYLAQVKGAIQAAVQFPESAKMLGENGRVLLRFTLHDGQIRAVKIMQKGSMSAFDTAAVAALHDARLPVVPAGLKDKNFDLNVWVEFRLSGQSE
ncbi:MAG: energy transducer TonB [Acidithiobacillus sp.]|uniref:TonB family protein n=1 Tax=Acidithiobacillus ferruginosus TaxID=3063951 RepID=A0ACD5ILB0_9PROT